MDWPWVIGWAPQLLLSVMFATLGVHAALWGPRNPEHPEYLSARGELVVVGFAMGSALAFVLAVIAF